ncbi:bifunctional diaminohydroxyphosphoribosylaminopyrimidine deaminase/5-amino-6-(5-phosphoribosylamino)uracil reductase RibD [Archangium violaceum]|uniref:bifunctional diaminohydroxyphosphoribosylaminopyrimidine deaminase/5-amino-6-(5-phosphoribosylamino)uracil reductase RibD n=1 Tax=Archangium violaceum TaxID=83451 RepID=UPI00194E6131|nr:bifunctional diaminohydroxyphosphoribosylaminopyrimidine deaminase/5-amino-6-(5-phosphoribosylamino)uracil reductase RibD [Archangium violaceum]QRO01347.1 bifunctional diaminohydroxyphosphoribosylaminopyrimidine deaminase/5-amino-6-(5-phosphoribosylamino)uracil reductase RibD [Archangium violaceum]
MISLRRGFGSGGLFSRTLPDPLQYGTEPVERPSREDDAYWMRLALERAMSACGRSNPNPTVGCVIVKEGRVLAEGATEVHGGRHAERVAIDSVADRSRLRGATLYVTLEPCSHTGRQPPCVDLVESCGFARCVIGLVDPNPLVAGGGLRRLRRAGVELRFGVLRDELIAWHLPFLFWHLASRPLMAAKWAQTLDGQLAYDSGRSQWISGPESRAYTHWLRQKYDAILVGAGTVLADHPALTVRSCQGPHHRQPIRLLFDPNARILSCPEEQWRTLLQRTFTAETPTVLLVDEAALTEARRERLQARGLEQVHLVPLPAGASTVARLYAALEDPLLAERVSRPLHSIMVEGGPRLLSALAEAGLLDLAHVFTAPTIGGGLRYRLGLSAPDGTGLRLHPFAHARLGDDLLTEYLLPSTSKLLEGLDSIPAVMELQEEPACANV